MKRAALYIRVSTEEQARHGLSLGDQRVALEEYARKNGFAVAGVYEDAGISARRSYKKRPALLRLLEDCRAGKVDTILFLKLDRWFRNVGNYYAVQEILDQCGVPWQAVKEDYETTTASGRLKVNIMLSVAQDEADRTSERIKFNFEQKRQRREPLTGVTPFGYKIEGKRFVKDPETEAAVQDFFRIFMQTGSVAETTAYLRENHGVDLNYLRVHKMLDAEAYCGTYYGVDGMCPPYITQEEHKRILSMRHRVVRKAKDNRIYLFSGLVVCGTCGSRVGAKYYKGRCPFSRYSCNGAYVKKNGCINTRTIAETKIEAYLLDTLADRLNQYKLRWQRTANGQKPKSRQKEISALRTKVGKLKDLYLNDLISLEEYKKDQADYLARIAELEAAEATTAAPNFSRIENMLSSDWKALYLASGQKERRDFWRLVVKEIRWYSDRRIEYDLLL